MPKEATDQDKAYMRRCIELAERAAGYNQPNPAVGALLVYQDRIIGEGWHQQYGQAHAEVNAVASVALEDAPLVPLSTLYVTLEPCFHFGKTPPCVDLVLRTGIQRLVIGCRDPFALVGGQSISKLRAAGVEVLCPVLPDEIMLLNRKFFTTIARQRPYIILKFAQSADGLLAQSGQRTTISSPLAQRLVHQWRSEEQAILVGTETARIDNPQLNNRYYGSRQPLRLVIDRHLRLPADLHLFDASQPTWVFTLAQNALPPNKNNLRYVPIDAHNPADFLPQLLAYLHSQKIQSVLVEGGAQLLNAFVEADLYDEIRQIVAPNIRLLQGPKAPHIHLQPAQQFELGPDHVNTYFHPKNIIYSPQP